MWPRVGGPYRKRSRECTRPEARPRPTLHIQIGAQVCDPKCVRADILFRALYVLK